LTALLAIALVVALASWLAGLLSARSATRPAPQSLAASVAAISMSQKAAAGSFLRWPERLGGGHALLN
jgi:hypothetical protein